jgi:IS5 family transposase
MIHHPTDSGLLGDGVRVLSRLRQLHRLARHKGEAATAQVQQAYGRLLAVAKHTHTQATRVYAGLQQQTTPKARRLVRQFEPCLPRVAQRLAQTVRRVLHGEMVPARDTLVSLFEPHTQLIVRRKTGKAVECGRKVWLEEVEGGLISGYRGLAEAGQDCPSWPDSLVAHQQRCGRPPRLLAADRGGYSAANEAGAQQARVTRMVIPYAGKAPPARLAQERTAWFRRGLRFRAGIEGRSSILRHRCGLDRCRDHGAAGLGHWVGWGIVTANLRTMAHTLAGRSAPTRARAA